MLAEKLKLGVSAPNKLCDGQTVNHSEICTTLILDRYPNR